MEFRAREWNFIIFSCFIQTRILSKFIKIGYEKPPRHHFFLPFLLFILCTQTRKFMKLHNMPRSHMRPSAEFLPFHDDAAWWKKFNFLLRWFFVFARSFALLSFFIYSSLALAKTKTRKGIFFSSCFADGLDDWYWIPFINFSLWKFMWSANWMGCVFLQMNWWFKGEWWRKKKEIWKKWIFVYCFVEVWGNLLKMRFAFILKMVIKDFLKVVLEDCLWDSFSFDGLPKYHKELEFSWSIFNNKFSTVKSVQLTISLTPQHKPIAYFLRNIANKAHDGLMNFIGSAWNEMSSTRRHLLLVCFRLIKNS